MASFAILFGRIIPATSRTRFFGIFLMAGPPHHPPRWDNPFSPPFEHVRAGPRIPRGGGRPPPTRRSAHTGRTRSALGGRRSRGNRRSEVFGRTSRGAGERGAPPGAPDGDPLPRQRTRPRTPLRRTRPRRTRRGGRGPSRESPEASE